MDFVEKCLDELKMMTTGHYKHNSLYFSLNEIKEFLPKIIHNLDLIDSLAITPYHITDDSIMEVYWLALSIKIEDVVQDKNNVLLSEAGKSNLEDLDEDIIEQWDYTYYEILKDDVSGFIECLNRYILYMEGRETSLRQEYNVPMEQEIYYEIW